MLTRIEERQVVRAELSTRDNVLRAWTADDTQYESGYPPDYGTELVTKLRAQDISFNVEAGRRSPWVTVAIFLLPLLLLFGFWLLLRRSAQKGASGLASFGRAKARRISPNTPKITFRDVAGVDEAVEELHEIKEFLENPKKFQALGARIPKGVLLYGPPGTGKTLLARAVGGARRGDHARDRRPGEEDPGHERQGAPDHRLSRDGPFGYQSADDTLRRTLEEQMRDAIASLGPGVDISGRLLDGDPSTALVNASKDLDLVTLGSRGYGPIRTVLLGSVSRTLVREGACSVVVLPRGAGTNRGDAAQ
jgi:nucleotide-binding universal stress UspA family protein